MSTRSNENFRNGSLPQRIGADQKSALRDVAEKLEYVERVYREKQREHKDACRVQADFKKEWNHHQKRCKELSVEGKKHEKEIASLKEDLEESENQDESEDDTSHLQTAVDEAQEDVEAKKKEIEILDTNIDAEKVSC